MTHTTKHTPGPWFSGCKGSKDIQVVADDNSMAPVGTSSLVIAKVNASVEGVEANAALIAAAPAMYAESKTLCSLVRAFMNDNRLYDGQLIQAIHNLETALAQAERRTL